MFYKSLRKKDKQRLEKAKSLVPGYLNIAGLDFRHDLFVFRMNNKPEYTLIHGNEIIIENAPMENLLKLYNKIVDFHNKMKG